MITPAFGFEKNRRSPRPVKGWFWVLWLVLVAQFSLRPARAGGIPAPVLKAGQFVYTVPPDFDPPYIGRTGLGEIQREAARLHFPFYVVVVKDYGGSPTGSTTEQLSNAVDELADSWAKNPKFNRATSSLAVLSYSPRKFRFLAGSTWRARLGLEGQGGQRFVDIFSSYTQGSSKDPKTGLIETMKALDAFVFESTDPKRLALKAESERRALVRRQLDAAATSLDAGMRRAQNLLGQPRQFLPADTSGLRAALSRARTARASNGPAVMGAAARDLEAQADRMDAFVSQKQRVYQAQIAAQARARQAALDAQTARQKRLAQQQFARTAALLGALALMGSLLVWQWRRFRAVSTQFRQKTAAWEEALLNAEGNHTRFFEERQSVTELAATSGATRQKYEEVTREVGAIYPTIEAMRDRIGQGKRRFGQGSFLRVKPLQQALALLDAEFEFDTQTLNRKALFEPPVRIIKVEPARLREQLQHQYAENIADWDELMQALRLRDTIAQDAFAATDLTQMLELCTQKGVPHRWLASHPLFGDDASDRSFYHDLNALRLPDPLAYKQQLEVALQLENGLKSDLSRLIAALELVQARRVGALPAPGDTIAPAPDDPAHTLQAARRAEADVTVFLGSKTAVEPVEEQARLCAELYDRALQQAAALQGALKNVESEISALAVRLDAARLEEVQAQGRLQIAAAIHAETGAARASLESGRFAVASAARGLEDARHLRDQKRHLEAQQQVQQASAGLAAAERDLQACVRLCEELDAQKRAYDAQIASLDAARAEAQASLRRYGQNHQLGGFDGFRASGPADYGLLMTEVNNYRQQMDDEVRRARRSYEEEQARLEREREAQRQRERDHQRNEERRRSAASSFSSSSSRSSSSSSGSSWSGGSSSSSGTDW